MYTDPCSSRGRREALHQHTAATGIALDVDPLVPPPSHPTTPDRLQATILIPRTSSIKPASRTASGTQSQSPVKTSRDSAKRKRKTKKPSHVRFDSVDEETSKVSKPDLTPAVVKEESDKDGKQDSKNGAKKGKKTKRASSTNDMPETEVPSKRSKSERSKAKAKDKTKEKSKRSKKKSA